MNILLAFDLVELFQDVLHGLFSSRSPFGLLGSTLGPFLIVLVPLLGLCWFVYYLLSLPMRREERSRLFLDLVETGLKRGQSVEQTIIEAAGVGDPILGRPFQKLASFLMCGLKLDEALERVPRLVPPSVLEALKVGVAVGDLARVLPVCRRQLRDGYSQALSGLNYLVVMVFMILPVFPVFFRMFLVWVFPKFVEIYKDMSEEVPMPWAGLLDYAPSMVFAYTLFVFCLQILVIGYVAGPRLSRHLTRRIYPVADRVNLWLPWRRKRVERNFSLMLAALLDGGVPEARALSLAADSTANRIVQRRVEAASASLQDGIALPEALRLLDGSGELQWRLGNALRSRQGFLPALSGWIEALDASAIQQEQAAAHILRMALVLLNGLLVGFFAVVVFKILTTLIQEGTLW